MKSSTLQDTTIHLTVIMPSLSFKFRGLIVPVLTPFNQRLGLNLSVIPTYANYLADKGVKGVLVNGTTGEGMSLSVEERKKIAETWADAVKTTKQHLMIQVGGAPLPDVIELARHAETIQANSILSLPELYYKPSNIPQLIDYLCNVGNAASNTPLLYYHIPMLSNVNIHMGQFLQTIKNEVPSFVGIKFTSTNLEEGAQAMNAQNKRFIVFQGSNQIIPAGCALGMDSFIPSAANAFPDIALRIIAAGTKGDSLTARESQEQLTKAVVAISKYGHWNATLKAAMNLLTPVQVGPLRPPIPKLNEEAVGLMRKDLEALGHPVKNY